MKRIFVGLLALAALALTIAAVGSAAPAKGTVVISHQLHHCHSWSFDGGTYAASIKATLTRGGSITFTNNDMMAHTLIQKSGPKAAFFGKSLLNHMGASITVRFTHPGVYVFGTKPGADYVKNLKTIGVDNVLRLTITVR